MPEFLHLLTPEGARRALMTALDVPRVATANIDANLALGRVTAEDVVAPHPLPEFGRSSVDGYAVTAAATHGASDSLPAYLRVVGEIPMGAATTLRLGPAECALIHTGGMLPDGADAVVMLEQTQITVNQDSGRPGAVAPAEEIEVLRAVATGENVITAGEDVTKGQVVIPRGVRLRPPEIGGLAALGITELRVAVKPRVALVSSGDEVVDVHRRPPPGQVRDVNMHALSALVWQFGGEPIELGIVPDAFAALHGVATRALAGCDLLIISGGSSASARDVTADVIRGLGAPGVLVHGINIRPGKPTILGVCDGKAVIGLPGNPVSALVIGYLFVVPVVERLLGLPPDRPRASIRARLSVNLPSQAGREDWWPVKLRQHPENGQDWAAEPIFGKSNLIFSLSAADGLVRIPADANGLSSGEAVQVFLL